MNIISLLTSYGALLIGTLYVLGFFIIVFNLSQYSIEDYQLLNIKYLHVGTSFALFSIAMLAAGLFVSLVLYNLLVIWSNARTSYITVNLLVALSLIASITTVIIVGIGKPKQSKLSKKKYGHFYFLILASIIGNLLPGFLLALFIFGHFDQNFVPVIYLFGYRQTLPFLTYTSTSIQFPFLITSIYALFFVAQIGYYSRFIYGKRNPISTFDRTGIGLPNKVRFILDEKYTELLSQVHVPIKQPGITEALLLIETTANDYLVMIPVSPKPSTIGEKVIKISKEKVFAVLYYPDDFLE